MLAEVATNDSWFPPVQSLLKPEVLFLGGVILLLISAWRIFKRRQALLKKQESGGYVPPPPISAQTVTPSELRATANELHSLLADLNDMSRRIAAQIDNRYIKIETTMAEADKKIKHLEGLLAQVEQYAVDPGDAPAAPEQPTQEPQVPPEVLIAEPQRTGMTSTHARIYDLADRGHSIHEIAQQVHLQPGEVDLILKLRPNHPAGTKHS